MNNQAEKKEEGEYQRIADNRGDILLVHAYDLTILPSRQVESPLRQLLERYSEVDICGREFMTGPAIHLLIRHEKCTCGVLFRSESELSKGFGKPIAVLENSASLLR